MRQTTETTNNSQRDLGNILERAKEILGELETTREMQLKESLPDKKNDEELPKEFERFLRYDRQLAESTITSYKLALRFLSDFIKPKTFENISQEDISSFLVFLKEGKINKQNKQKGLAIGSIALMVNGLRTFYKFFAFKTEKKEIQSISFFLSNIIRAKKINSKPIEVPTPEEIKKLRQTLKAYLKCPAVSNTQKLLTLRTSAIMEMFLQTGCRASELKGLQVKDVDFEKQTIFIKNAKGGRQRISIFGDSAKKVLIRWLKEKNLQPEDNLFGLRSKVNSDIAQIIKLWTKKAQINPKLHAHSFRHYYITESQRQGADLQAIADQVGHRDLNVTRNTYTHFDGHFLTQRLKGVEI